MLITNEADSRDFLKGSTEQNEKKWRRNYGTFEHKAYTKRGNTKAIQFCGELNVRKEQQLDDGVVDRVVLRCAGVSRLGSHTKRRRSIWRHSRFWTCSATCWRPGPTWGTL